MTSPPHFRLLLGALLAGSLLLSSRALAVTDPEMEPLTATLDSRFAVIRDWWEGKTPADEVEKVLAENITLETPWPKDLTGKELPGNLTAASWTRPSNPHRVVGTESALKLLALPSPPASRTEMKIVSAVQNETTGEISSEVLVGVFFYGEASRREIRSKWRCQWTSQNAPPTLSKLELLSYSELTLAQSQAPLVDRTTAVLQPQNHTDADLIRGNFYWRHRIEASLDPDPFGQNGISVADLNGDGLQDLYLCHFGGLPNRIFLQAPDGTLIDHGTNSNLDFFDNTTAALFVDFDNDGDQDAAIAIAGAVLICKNDGKGIFTIHARHEEATHGFSLSAADYDLDGDLDLYVCQYHRDGEGDDQQKRGAIPVPYPVYDANNGGRNVLFRNEGDLKFSDVTAECGLEASNLRFSFACLWEDWNRDGYPDLVVVNDFGRISSYQNLKGKFVEDSAERGFDQSGFGMGCVSADFNHDGWMDLYTCNMFSGAGSRITREPQFRSNRGELRRETFQQMAAGNSLFFGNESQTFREGAQDSGVDMGRWSWGSATPDLNNDSWPDLLVANGFVTGIDLDDL